MKRKGFSSLIYISFLILIFIIIGSFLIKSMLDRQVDEAEVGVNNIVYIMRDAVDLAKLYTENSARLSLYQAMYDLGRNGGFNSIDGQYAVWCNATSENAPTPDEVIQNLGTETLRNFRKYTAVQTVITIFPVRIPSYNDMVIFPEGSYLRIFSEGTAPIETTRIAPDGEEIRMQKSSIINVSLSVPYIQLFEESRRLYDEIKAELPGCNIGKIEKNIEKFCCHIKSEVVNSANCEVKVEAVSRDVFLIWNGNEVALEPITLIFMLKQN